MTTQTTAAGAQTAWTAATPFRVTSEVFVGERLTRSISQFSLFETEVQALAAFNAPRKSNELKRTFDRLHFLNAPDRYGSTTALEIISRKSFKREREKALAARAALAKTGGAS
jgi:hypothetical protein